MVHKYQISFIYDVAAYLGTLERIKSMKAALFVPVHAEASKKIAPLAQYNIDKVMEIAEKFLCFWSEPRCFEAVLQKLFVRYGLVMDFEQYVLIGSTVRSYLSWLLNEGRLGASFQAGMLLWKRK